VRASCRVVVEFGRVVWCAERVSVRMLLVRLSAPWERNQNSLSYEGLVLMVVKGLIHLY
jgi:hypothetical protein